MYTKRAKEMQCDVQSCRHQLNRPPDLVEDVDGVTYLVFECLRCDVESASDSTQQARSTASSSSRLSGNVHKTDCFCG
jgi:hypothetical protein